MTEGLACVGGDVGISPETWPFETTAQRICWERVIVCGSPETSKAKEWRPTIGGVSQPHVFWYGDNLDVMREHIKDESVDLIYLDPPFNSRRAFNRFFDEADGSDSDAQRKAFEDYWQWGPEAELAYSEIVHPRGRRRDVPASLSQTLEMLRGILQPSNMLAYISMMTLRLIEMRRALKQNGSLYLHCDPTASHYLRLVLDALFGATNFRSEIIWKRHFAHNDAKQGRALHGRIHDSLLFVTKSDEWTWNAINTAHDEGYLESHYSKIEPESGRRFQDVTLTAAKPGGDTSYDWKGKRPPPGRYWAYARKNMEEFEAAGRIYYTRNNTPRLKYYLDEVEGLPLQDLWTDVPPVNSQAHERVGYPTQKPVALLERIIRVSSNPGDVVLDPFCGCGTAVVAAQKLGRKWIGIDVTHVAVSVLKKRLEADFPGLEYRVRGEPEDVASARRLADEKWEEFQAWIVDKVGGVPLNPEEEKKVAKKGKDGGIDGYFMFRDDPKAERSKRMILSVKAGKSVSPEMIDALHGVVTRNNATAGVFLTAYPVTPNMRKTALAYGHYESELFAPGKRYPKIQIVTVEDIFDARWRGLDYPGSNTSRRSEPPAGTAAAAAIGGALKQKPIRKGKTTPADELEQFKLKAPEAKAATAKQQALKLKVPGAKGRK